MAARDPLSLLVLSHLDWGAAASRRDLFRTAATERPVVFVEPPRAEAGAPPSWDLQYAEPRLTICRAILPAACTGFEDAPADELATMLRQLLRWQDLQQARCAAWLSTPATLPLVRRLLLRLVVYDRAAAAAALRAPLRRFDLELVRSADLVFTAEPGTGAGAWRACVAPALELAERARAERASRARLRGLRIAPS